MLSATNFETISTLLSNGLKLKFGKQDIWVSMSFSRLGLMSFPYLCFKRVIKEGTSRLSSIEFLNALSLTDKYS